MTRLPDLLLAWYDRHHRILPWRMSPADQAKGRRANPYHVWLSEIMLQQTTVATVKDYFIRFITCWPCLHDLAQADDGAVMAEWAGLGYYARARNALKCAREICRRHNGRFPETEEELLRLPGIGPYTAAAIAAIAFDRPATVVDGNVERVMARLFHIDVPLPAAKPQIYQKAQALTPAIRPGDYAQAVMDLGATVCTPRSPDCMACPWQGHCTAYQAGTATELPRKAAKPPKPVRQGQLWLLIHPDKGVLLEKRPPKGLLGGMIGFPCGGWDNSPLTPPITAPWRALGQFRHTFTHFHLDMQVFHAHSDEIPNRGHFVPMAEFNPKSLPRLMQKAWQLAPLLSS